MKYEYYYWKNVYSHSELQELHNLVNENSIDDYEDKPAENTQKKLNLKTTHWEVLKNKLLPLEQLWLKTNQSIFGYNIWPQYDHNPVLLNEYKSGDEYNWHSDGSNSNVFDIKFTMLINASLKKYEGGEFNLFLNGGPKHIIELDNPGDVLVFKSHHQHKVNPIKKGVRHSITMFYSGPRFT